MLITEGGWRGLVALLVSNRSERVGYGFQSATEFVTGLMDSMDLDNDGRALFAERVAMDIAATGNADVAQQIRHEFGVITEQFADDHEPDPTPDPEAEPATAGPESDATPEPDPNM